MLNKAIEKIKKEMNQKDSYAQVVGEFLLKHLEDHPEDAEKILSEDKTILKSLKEMENMARKKAVGGKAMFTPQEGFEIVLKYFGLSAERIELPTNIEVPVEKTKKKFDVRLEDFL